MCNFAMGTILGKGFAQALVHTVHSTRAFDTCVWAKPFPKIVHMVKLDILDHFYLIAFLKLRTSSPDAVQMK